MDYFASQIDMSISEPYPDIPHPASGHLLPYDGRRENFMDSNPGRRLLSRPCPGLVWHRPLGAYVEYASFWMQAQKTEDKRLFSS